MPGLQPNTWATEDLGIAAFAAARGLELQGVTRQDGDVLFTFMDPKGEGPGLPLKFANSPEQLFDAKCQMLKKLAFGDRNRDRERDRRLNGGANRR